MPTTRPTLRAAFAAALSCLAVVGAAPAAHAQQGPAAGSFTQALPYSLKFPSASPAGANDASCRPSAAHPRPVVLLHGTFANRYNSFAALSPALARAGYCVFAPNFGRTWLRVSGGMRSIRQSAAQVATFIDGVRASTGAEQVDVVGYSQGAVVARAYLKWFGGADPADPSRTRVHTFVGLSGVHHGTRLLGLTDLFQRFGLLKPLGFALGQGPLDIVRGSALLAELNAGGEATPGVHTTMIATRTDAVNLPYQGAYLTPSPGQDPDEVTNVLLQRGCAVDLSDHFNITYSPRAIGLVLRALDPASSATTAGALPCTLRLPFV